MNVPIVIPRLFYTAFERTSAIHDGEASVDHLAATEIRSLLTAFYGEDPGPFETALVTVATEVFGHEGARASFLARVDVLTVLFADKGLVEAWGKHGWVRRSPIDPDRFAPARYVIEAAAICSLQTPHPTFDLKDFHAAAYKRAAARGVEFW